MYLDRLRCPHLDIEATSANYSSLCTAHCPHEYETRLVKATAAAQGAKAKLNSERRHGATRQDYEDQLAGVFAGPPSTEADFQALMPYPASRLPLLQSYIAWETDPKAKPPGAKSGPTMDPMLIRAVFERTLTAYAEASSNTSDDSERLAYKDGEASIWVRYVNWLRNSKRLDDALVAANRAVRACPEVATVWISLLYLMVRNFFPASGVLGSSLMIDRSYTTAVKMICFPPTIEYFLLDQLPEDQRRPLSTLLWREPLCRQGPSLSSLKKVSCAPRVG